MLLQRAIRLFLPLLLVIYDMMYSIMSGGNGIVLQPPPPLYCYCSPSRSRVYLDDDAYQSSSSSSSAPILFPCGRQLQQQWQAFCATSYAGKAKPLKLLPRASSFPSAPLSGSEPLLDVEQQKKKKKEKVAGIDQDELLDPRALADPDSCFCEFKEVQIHHKVYNPQPPPSSLLQPSSHTLGGVGGGLPIILLHGFGASVFSWTRVMKPLADINGSKVLAFDRPAFGLTSRPHSPTPTPTAVDAKPLSPYSMAFSVLATLFFIDFLAADKAVLVGHSAGSLVAVNSYFEAPERIAALILVAPAIFAPLGAHGRTQGSNVGRSDQLEGAASNPKTFGGALVKILDVLSKFAAYIAQAMMQMLKKMGDMVNSLYKKALSAVLLSAFGVMLIRIIIDKFGIAAVRNAWYDSNKVTEHVVHGYTKPLRVKGWDKALAKFTAEMLVHPESQSKPPLSQRLTEIACPVLIVTGDSDRIVPSWNAKRLAKAIPGSCLEVIEHCGHLPHEEKAEDFVAIVDRFLQRAFGDASELSVQVSI